MNAIELLIFLLLCLGLGFLGHLVSPRYGWLAGAILAIVVSILLLVGTYRQLFKDFRRSWKDRLK